jgi:hypothetical protein
MLAQHAFQEELDHLCPLDFLSRDRVSTRASAETAASAVVVVFLLMRRAYKSTAMRTD